MSKTVASQMYRHAEAEYPHEACGILVGRSVDDRRDVVRIVETENIETSRMHDRFVLDPQTLMRTMKETRGTDEEVFGYYHSHPDHPSKPSDTDLEFAKEWPDHAFLIVEVRDGQAVGCQSWVVPSGLEVFIEEIVEIA